MEIEYRTGEQQDCEKIADMINIASGGVVEYLFHELVPGILPVQVMANILENDNYPYTYRSAVVACDGNELVGTALSYPSSHHEITDEMRGFFPADRLDHLGEYYSSRAQNTWFLDALCVMEGHRRRGIGEKLISLTKERAVENGYRALSLIAFADNALALPVYERTGFDVLQKVELRANDFIKNQGGCLLMKCEITN